MLQKMTHHFHAPRGGGTLAVVFVLLLALGALPGSARAASFTIAALPDTQSYVKSDALNLGFEAQTQWLATNAAAQNIVFVTQLGDIVSEGGGPVTEGATFYPNNEAQWARANRAMSTLDGVVPWNTSVGNHELDQVDVASSGFSQWKSNFGPATTGRFNAMPGWGGGSPDDLSSYQFFSGGSRQYMIMHLQLDVPDPTIAWAQGIIDANPGTPTIISTHVYEGTAHGPPNSPYLPGPGRNSQLQVFDKLIKDNEQILMVLSAHTGQELHQTKLNSEGSEVFQIVQDYASRPNGGDGWMRLIEFDEAAGKINVRTFSPTLDEFETHPNSQFSFSLDFNDRLGPAVPEPSTLVLAALGLLGLLGFGRRRRRR